MRRSVPGFVLGLLCVLVSMGTAVPIQAQEAPSDLTTTVDGVTLSWALRTGASGPGNIEGLVAVGPPDASKLAGHTEVHRLIFDSSGAVRFAYAVRVVREGGDRVRIHARPLDAAETVRLLTSVQSVVAAARDRSVATLPSEQSASALVVGDIVRLELFQHRRTGEPISDVLTVRAIRPRVSVPPER